MEKDLLIIGGGINGVGVAADAAGRGLSVTLCEMGDLASGTSSASSRLIHGGLRYLENYEFKLVRESLLERSILLHNAPHLVKLQPFVLPHCPWLRPYWMIRAGLFIYDHLAYDPEIPTSHALDSAELAALELKQQYKKALRYYDCTEDDGLLTVHVALLAKQHGAEILTRTKLVNAIRHDKYWTAILENSNGRTTHSFKAIVNAAGPRVQQVANDILNIATQYKTKLVKGSHIIVPKLFTHNDAFILQNQDDRVVFLIPYLQDFTLIGTTEVVLDQISSEVTISKEEIEYLCAITNQFVAKQISPQDIINTYSGIRPLHDDKHSSPGKITRDYALDFNFNMAPVISIFGGKITTYRHLAEELVDKLSKTFPQCGNAWTKTAYLPGGNFINGDVNAFRHYLISVYPNLPARVLMHYVNNYGTRAAEIVVDAQTEKDLGIHFGALLYQREVDFLVAEEWAQTAEDILWRRGKQGLWFKPEQVNALEKYLNKF